MVCLLQADLDVRVRGRTKIPIPNIKNPKNAFDITSLLTISDALEADNEETRNLGVRPEPSIELRLSRHPESHRFSPRRKGKMS